MAARLTDQTKLDRAWTEQRAAHAAFLRANARLQKAMAAIPPIQARIKAAGGVPKNGAPLSPYGYDAKGNNVVKEMSGHELQQARA